MSSSLFKPLDALKKKKIRKLLETGKWAFKEKDYQEAYSCFSQAAALKSPEGEYWLATCYLGGYGVAFSLQDAFLWLESAARAGWSEAEYMFALLNMRGVPELQITTGYDIFNNQKQKVSDLKVDMEAACFWAKKNAERGNADGQALYAYILSGQINNQKDLDEVYRLYDLAIAQGSPQGYMGKGLLLLKNIRKPEDYTEVVRLLEVAAEHKMGAALYTLATLYEIGKGTPPNSERAVALYKEAAELGIRPAQALYGVALKKGSGVEKDVMLAESWLRKAARQGDADAASVLGDMLAKGDEDVSPNYNESAQWYNVAIQQNNHKGAAYSLGLQYLKGLGVNESVSQAIELFQLSADQGYEPAIVVLTDIVIQSPDVMSIDKLINDYLYPKAQEGNHTFMFLLAKALMKKSQLNKDISKEKEAREWLKQCSEGEKNNAHAQYWYGRMLIQGIGGERNIEEGYTWISLAADKGDIDAQLLWASLLLDGFGDKNRSQAEEAIIYFNQAAEHGSVSAMFSLGAIYGGGNNFPQNRTEAQKWFLKAAEQGHSKAQLMLGRYFLRGLAGITDINQAYHWLHLAKDAGEEEADIELNYLAQLQDGTLSQVDNISAGITDFSVSESEQAGGEADQEQADKQVEIAPGLFLFNDKK